MFSHLRRIPRGLSTLAVGLAFAPSLLLAQSHALSVQSPQTDSTMAGSMVDSHAAETATPSTRLSGPRATPAALTTAPRVELLPPATLPADDNVNMGPNLALMGAGAAGVVIGLLIGGDGGTAIAVGGGVVGLIGLYRYLR